MFVKVLIRTIWPQDLPGRGQNSTLRARQAGQASVWTLCRVPDTYAPFRGYSDSRQVPHGLRRGLRSCALAGLPGCTLPRKVLDKLPVPDYPIAMATPGP